MANRRRHTVLLTPRVIDGIRKGEYRTDTASRGLWIVRSKTGRYSWIHRYRFDGKLQQVKLGFYAESRSTENGDSGFLSISEARSEVERQKGILKLGLSPREQKRSQQAREIAEIERDRRQKKSDEYTVEALCEDYWREHARSLRSAREQRRIVDKYIVPRLGSRRAQELTRADVVGWCLWLESHGKRQAGVALAVLRGAYAHALDLEKVPANPCARIRRARKYASRPRENYLDNVGLRHFLSSLPVSGLSGDIRDAVRLQLLTAARIGEVLGAEWSDIDLNAAIWTQPRGKTKNQEQHRVMLSHQAADLLAARKQSTGYVFPGAVRNRPLRGDSVAHALRRAQKERLRGLNFTAHDLRRTALTHLGEMGCPTEVQNRISNHKDRSVAATYNLATYDREARSWLQRWADKLDLLVEDNVVQLQADP